jgi:hypothetical protein
MISTVVVLLNMGMLMVIGVLFFELKAVLPFRLLFLSLVCGNLLFCVFGW